MEEPLPTSINVTVPDKCMGLEMADGTKYDAHNGKVTIDNPRHASAWLKDPASGMVGRQQLIGLSGLHTRDNDCPCCGFAAWPWTVECPKCHTMLGSVGRSEDA